MEDKADSRESIPGEVDGARLLDDLVRVEVRLYAVVDARLRSAGGHGLGRLEVLRAVARVPSCRVADVAGQLGITVGAASKAVDRQVRDGLVERLPHPEDGRSSILELTTSGRAALDDLEPLLDRITAEVFAASGVEPAELQRLGRTLRDLRSSLAAL
ncbi:MarR family transcriptional regulator [Nocardioides sp. zg-1228]|nr:MarR family transcriptional regulator [Nocardioides sp. zg-1228]